MGGIMTGEDALEFILAGASAVAVGTANFVNPRATLDVIDRDRRSPARAGRRRYHGPYRKGEGRVRIVTSLKSKIIIAVSAILAVTIGVGTWINIGYQRAQMEDALEDNVLIISNTIERSLANAMLDGKSKEVQHILEAVGSYHNIQEVKIFSPNGVVLKSSKPWMIGRKVDPVTQKWFLADKFKKPIKRRDEGIFSVLFPIENDARCFHCHGSQVKLNGMLAVDVSMAQTQEKVRELSKTMFLWAVGRDRDPCGVPLAFPDAPRHEPHPGH